MVARLEDVAGIELVSSEAQAALDVYNNTRYRPFFSRSIRGDFGSRALDILIQFPAGTVRLSPLAEDARLRDRIDRELVTTISFVDADDLDDEQNPGGGDEVGEVPDTDAQYSPGTTLSSLKEYIDEALRSKMPVFYFFSKDGTASAIGKIRSNIRRASTMKQATTLEPKGMSNCFEPNLPFTRH